MVVSGMLLKASYGIGRYFIVRVGEVNGSTFTGVVTESTVSFTKVGYTSKLWTSKLSEWEIVGTDKCNIKALW